MWPWKFRVFDVMPLTNLQVVVTWRIMVLIKLKETSTLYCWIRNFRYYIWYNNIKRLGKRGRLNSLVWTLTMQRLLYAECSNNFSRVVIFLLFFLVAAIMPRGWFEIQDEYNSFTLLMRKPKLSFLFGFRYFVTSQNFLKILHRIVWCKVKCLIRMTHEK